MAAFSRSSNPANTGSTFQRMVAGPVTKSLLGSKTGMTSILFANAHAALIAGCAAAMILAWMMWGMVADEWLIEWTAAIFVVYAVRYYFFRGYRAGREADPSIVAWYTAGSFVAGIVWGAAGFLFFSSGAVYHQVFLAFVFSGVVAGAVGSYAAWPPAFYAFAVPALGPLAIRFFWEGSEMSAVMGGMIVVFGAVLAVLTHNVNRHLRKSVGLQNEVAERKRSEEQLRKSETIIREILENSPNGVADRTSVV